MLHNEVRGTEWGCDICRGEFGQFNEGVVKVGGGGEEERKWSISEYTHRKYESPYSISSISDFGEPL